MKSRYIRKFKLGNVKTFEAEAEIDFCLANGRVARWTVILGENGIGKTTLLQYLAGSTPVTESPDVAAIVNDGGKKKKLPSTRPLIMGQDWFGWHMRNLRKTKRPTKIEFGAIFSDAVDSLSNEREDPKYKDWMLSRLTFDVRDQRHVIESSFIIVEDDSFVNEVNIFGYGAGRHVAGPASPYLGSDAFARNKIASPTQTLFHDDIPLISPEQWLLGLHHTSTESGKIGSLSRRKLELAQRCLTQALPGIKRIHVGPHGSADADKSMSVLFETPYGIVPFGCLSLGYRSMAAWLTDFIKRMIDTYPELEKPEEGGAVVIIDEFDLHMHPAWQREVMDALSQQFPNVQFIITAHSPLIVQHRNDETKVIVLRKTEAKDKNSLTVVADSNPHFAAGWRVDQILQSDLYSTSARSKKHTELMARRLSLLGKAALNSHEKRELESIEAELDAEAPPGIKGSQISLLNEFKSIIKS